MIFYPYIKGCALDSGNQKVYTYINFTTTGMPEVRIGNSDKGSIATTENENSFSVSQDFNEGFKVPVGKKGWFGSYSIGMSNTTSKFILSYEYSAGSSSDLLEANGSLFNFLKDVTVPNISVTNKCEAGFFNATSDKRAKTDIHYLNIDALSLINQVRLYSFEYKDTLEPSIGVIAQELQDINIQGFKLVDNIYASGENGDYMRVKETKLIYVLWKGIQELTQEVKYLRDEVARLKYEH